MKQAETRRGAGKPRGSETDESGNGNGIRAMLVGLAVLQSLGAARRPLPLKDVASVSGLTPSRVHRYLASLVRAGFVRQDERSGYYELGQAVVELGLLALSQLEPIKVGTRALQTYSDLSGLDGHLAVWGSAGPTVIRWISGRLGDQIKIEEGRVLPLLWSATGRVLMAYRQLEEVLPLAQVEAQRWNEAHPDNPIEASQIERMCASVRTDGLASSLPDHANVVGKSLMGSIFPRPNRLQLETLSVPIFDHLGRVPMALTFFGVDHISLHDSESRYREQLCAIAAQASRELGYS